MKLITYRRDYNKNDIWTELVQNEAMAIRLACVYRATIIKIEDYYQEVV